MFSDCDDVSTRANHPQARLGLEQFEYGPEGDRGVATIVLWHGAK